MAQVKVVAHLEAEGWDLTDRDALALAAAATLMEWLVEAGPSHVANYLDVTVEP